MLSQIECNPKRIIQIVSGSRSGSSLLKSLLAASPDVISFAGEEEPYYTLSGNGAGLTSDSDAFTTMVNSKLFRRLLETELVAADPWEWRLSLQYRGAKLAELLNDLDYLDNNDPFSWLRLHRVAGHYDGCLPAERLPFRDLVTEMPPFVLPKLDCTPSAGQTLLLKCPYSAYRRGVLEKIFPTTEITYVVLTRNPGATINGLIDGWLAPYGFHKHRTSAGWWKFDQPPGWQDYWCSTLAERSWFQWHSSYSRIVEWPGIRVRFEDVLVDHHKELRRLSDLLGICHPRVPQLPSVMSTVAPRPGRWRVRADVIGPLLGKSVGLIRDLSYQDQAQWI